MNASAPRPQAVRTALELADATSHAGGARLWTARVEHVAPTQWTELDSLLDHAERAQAAKFRFEADRRAYVLAHALRRAALSAALDADPRSIEFSSGANGQPLLTSPHASRPLHFSHSRCRRAVAVAIASSPVGVDIEAKVPSAADAELLGPYVANAGTHDFFTSWTTLEAFWKAVGTGLASSNPRICCHATTDGTIAVALESQPDRPLARASVIDVLPGCTISIAVVHRIETNPTAVRAELAGLG